MESFLYFLAKKLGCIRCLKLMISNAPGFVRIFTFKYTITYLLEFKRYDKAYETLVEVLFSRFVSLSVLQKNLSFLLSVYDVCGPARSVTVEQKLIDIRSSIICLDDEKEGVKKVFLLISIFELSLAESVFLKIRDNMDRVQRDSLRSYFNSINVISSVSLSSFENTIVKNGCGCVKLYLFPILKYDAFIESGSVNAAVDIWSKIYAFFESHGYRVLVVQQNLHRLVGDARGGVVVSYHTHSSAGKDRIHIKESSFNKLFMADTQGYSGWHTMSNWAREDLIRRGRVLSRNERDRLVDSFCYFYREKRLSKYPQKLSLNRARYFNGGGSYFFFPLQVETDVVSNFAYVDVVALLKLIMRISDKYGYRFLIKRHPKCSSYEVSRLLKKCRNYKNICVVDDNVHDCISASKAVVLVNSGVGLESLVYGKTVISTGLSEYSCASQMVRNENELINILTSFEPTDEDVIRDFVYFYIKTSLLWEGCGGGGDEFLSWFERNARASCY